MYRISKLSHILKQSTNKLTSDLLVKGKKRLFLRYQPDHFYAFPSVNEVAIPLETAKHYAKVAYNQTIPIPVVLDSLPISTKVLSTDSAKSIQQVAVLLGHYNHGKTTLLDSLINITVKEKRILHDKAVSNLVAEEVHGITQEVRTRAAALQNTNDDRNRLILTLIDTPGQEIFYRMRNTGAQVANLGILLVSIDDGVSLR
jgi:hypothetical protein